MKITDCPFEKPVFYLDDGEWTIILPGGIQVKPGHRFVDPYGFPSEVYKITDDRLVLYHQERPEGIYKVIYNCCNCHYYEG